MVIESVKIKDIKPYENNPRINEESAKLVANSIKEFGFKVPLVLDKDNIIVCGHTRYKAANILNLKEVPCVMATDLTEEQIKAYRLADNKVAEFSEWDMDLLELEMDDILNIDMLEFGFESEEEQEEIKEEKELEEPPAVPYSKQQDIWILGKHRLMCGSSTEILDINKLLNKASIDLIHTDPPYGMNAVSKSNVLKERYGTDILGDDDNSVAIDSFKISRQIKATNEVWWGANYYSECLPSSECWIVWDKNNGTSDQTDCELAWATYRSVVRKFVKASEKTNRIHPTQKPTDLVLWIFEKFKNKGEVKTVLDLFGGSGVTLISCEMDNKINYTMEFDEKFVDAIVNRYVKYKDNNAEDVILIRNGKEYKFKDIKEQFYNDNI